ncbi:MAG: RNA polymerase factor sigma-54 [bacterium]|nr:RNA polymerase factor sigma-54 [bacterium]
MVIAQKIEQRQSQSLTLTPQLRQSIAILALSHQELLDQISQSALENPFLELKEKDLPAETEKPIEKEEPAEDSNLWTGNSAFEGQNKRTISDFESGPLPDKFAHIADTPASLREHLLQQSNMTFQDIEDRLIASQIIDELDETGYLESRSLQGVSHRLEVPQENVRKIWNILRTLDPAGAFSHTLAECLEAQLRGKGLWIEGFDTLLKNLNLVARHDLKELGKMTAWAPEKILSALQDLKTLDPKPGLLFRYEPLSLRIPDVIVEPKPAGGWRVFLNPETLPKVLVNETYSTEILKDTCDKETKNYVQGRLSEANWLVKALNQRANTVLKVSKVAMSRQISFLKQGIKSLRPLTLKDVAEKIEMHESTVSRAIAHKYIGTPRGIFSMKYFFTNSIASFTNDSGAVSAESVRARLKELIDKEAPLKPLSDEKLLHILNHEGTLVARRTVTKYREALGIPSSFQRKRLKKI